MKLFRQISFSLSLMLFFPVGSPADTVVWLQNNTKRILEINNTIQVGANMSNSKWRARSADVPAGKRFAFLTFARAGAVKNGKEYVFETKLRLSGHSNNKPLVLKQKVKGTLTHSKLWQSVSGVNKSQGWHKDRATHSSVWLPLKKGSRFGLYYRAFDSPTSNDDAIEYVVVEEPHSSSKNTADEISVLSYNVYMLPRPKLKHNGKERSRLISSRLRGHDVIVFNEMFARPERKLILSALKKEYPHQTGILNPGSPEVKKAGKVRLKVGNGGVLIVSRWPFIGKVKTMEFKNCDGIDCYARKGAMRAKIKKMGKMYHIVGTHLDNGDVLTKLTQVKELKQFIRKLKIPKSQPMIIAGDFNIDSREGAPKKGAWGWGGLLRNLSAGAVAKKNPSICSRDERINDLMKKHRQFNLDLKLGACRNIDHVLYSKDHLIPSRSYNEVLLLRPGTPYKIAKRDHKYLGKYVHRYWDLSDHNPVLGVFRF